MKKKFLDLEIKPSINRRNNQISNTIPRRKIKDIFPNGIPNKIKIRIFK